MENFLDEDEIYNVIESDSDEESMEEYLHNHEPSYYLRPINNEGGIRWDDYQHARFLNPERFHEYELNNDIRNNHVEPNH